jgi:hypothetical protein
VHILNNIPHLLVSEFYRAPDRTLLSQGDILSCELLKKNLPQVHEKNVCSEVYPYFFDHYSYAIVLNADCDIFRSKSRPVKVRCLQIAAVVEASEYIKNLLLEVSNEVHYKTRLIDNKTYGEVVRKFESLINQQEKLYFYLPENLNIGFKTAHLARLDTSISIQIDDEKKYNSILQSRIEASISEPFKSKLGENFATLFDRTGLTDVKDILEDKYTLWRTKELEKYFMKVPVPIYRRSIKEALDLAAASNPDSPEYVKKLTDIVTSHNKKTPKDDVEDLPAFLALRKILSNKMKPDALEQTLSNIASDAVLNEAFMKLLELESGEPMTAKSENEPLKAAPPTQEIAAITSSAVAVAAATATPSDIKH